MKTQMRTQMIRNILGALVLVASVQARAQEPSPWAVLAQNRVSNGKSVWVTMYNMFDSVREAKCVRDGEEALFEGYYPPLKYYIRAEVKANVDCGGETIRNFRNEVDPSRGVYAKVISYNDGGREDYMWKFSWGPNAQPPQAVAPIFTQEVFEKAEQAGLQAKGGSTLEAQNGLTDKTVWVTIYNFFGSIRDSGCVQPGERKGWDDYYDMGLAYKMRFEVKSGANCGGDSIADTGIGISDIHGTKGGLITKEVVKGQERYVVAPYER